MNAPELNASAYFDEGEIVQEILRTLPRDIVEFLKYRLAQDGVYDRKIADDFTVLRERLGDRERMFTSSALQAFKQAFIVLDDAMTEDFGYEPRRELFTTHRDRKSELREKHRGLFKAFERAHADLVSSTQANRAESILLSTAKIRFNDSEAAIYIGDKICKLPPNKNGHYFCRAMFNRPARVPVDWSEVSKEISGVDPLDLDDNKGAERTVKDAVYAVNRAIAKAVNTADKLFIWNSKTIVRNW